MILFPNCKINLGLSILRKREDGFHDLETIFYPLPVRDVLEIVPAAELLFTSSGITIPGDQTSNLCLKAFELLKKDYPALPPVHIWLHKNIPIGAGLGGGSSDGAFMLKILNERFRLQLAPDRLQEYASHLGSDCPFFLLNTPCLGGGRGEKLRPLSPGLLAPTKYSFLLINPGIHVSTAWAFSQCSPHDNGRSLETIVQKPVREWKELLVNDFEEPLFRQYPRLEAIKTTLYQQGALYASLTGSGSSLYGIFEKGKLPAPQPQADEQIIRIP